MSNEQREKILQILYKERSNPLQVFDREDLAQQMGIPWHDIQPEVAYLVEKGYVATKSRKIGTHIYHMFSITTQGVDFVEKPPLRKIDVFISSPGDVSEERHIVKRVINRCNRVHSIAERFQSGTEYEFVDAYRHNQKHGKPYILMYRGLKPFPPETDPEQLRAVEAFFKRFEGEHAEFKGLYKTYRSSEEFEDMLFHDIDTAISKNLIKTSVRPLAF